MFHSLQWFTIYHKNLITCEREKDHIELDKFEQIA